MNPILFSIGLPVVLGCLCWMVSGRNRWLRESLTIAGSLALFVIGIRFFISIPAPVLWGQVTLFSLDALGSMMLLACGFFGFLIALYSIPVMRDAEMRSAYYSAFLWTLGAAFGVILSNHLLLLLFFWGMLAVTLYMLILCGKSQTASESARKALIIVGGSDGILLLGIFCIYALTSTFEMHLIRLPLDGGLAILGFVCLGIAAFAKAGAIPFHTWIPDMASSAPVPGTALMPASLDKLLGIYLLMRMATRLFILTPVFNTALLILGTVTILAAVMRALVQHDLKRLLAYHAVSQVGYMIVGIGTGNPIGFAGALFHMLNNTIYKTGLFLAGGAVESQAGTSDLDKLGGIGRLMPWTFVTFLVSAFAISGVPPMNGFVSKWIIYQGLFEMNRSGNSLWIIWLAAAMFGSGLTLASFMKLTHAIFLGTPGRDIQPGRVKEIGLLARIPMIVLAVLSIGFGIFAYGGPMRHLILPSIGEVDYPGIWSPGYATLMVLLGLVAGLLIYGIGRSNQNLREQDSFIGGEKLPVENRVTGTGFYETIQSLPGLRFFYRKAETRSFDIYVQGSRLVAAITRVLRKSHTGVLTFYLVWAIAGLVLLLVWLMGR
ncbi:NADH-quinone oxidoreductase subunit L [bacterium]|nr:NADH-quinone oxidoreductase subunit L [bacterium]